jgi:hypothetical protein
MDVPEDIVKAARIICARSMSGFCRHVGGAQGCKVGRGTSDYTQCIANEDQLILSGYIRMAGEIAAAIRQS